jgi:hypothetical protein
MPSVASTVNGAPGSAPARSTATSQVPPPKSKTATIAPGGTVSWVA